MIPDPPHAESPLVAGGEGNPARGPSHEGSRADAECWVCAHPITRPDGWCWTDPHGRVVAAHHACLVLLGETDLDLPPAA